MSVTKILQATKIKRLLPRHPLADTDEAMRQACAQLWIWVAEVDGPRNDHEQAWLKERFEWLPVNDIALLDIKKEDPEESNVLAVFEKLSGLPQDPCRWIILCDCWLLAVCDNPVESEEEEFLSLVAEFIGIGAAEANHLRGLALALAAGDKSTFRHLAATWLENHTQTDPLFWQVLLACLGHPPELIRFLADLFVGRGMHNEKIGLPSEALQQYQEALTIDPACGMARLLRGDIFARQSSWQAALGELDAAIELLPQSGQVHFRRGIIHQLLDDRKQALQDYTRAISLSPEFGAAYHHRGQIYAGMSAYAEAIADFEQGLEREPTNDELYHSLAYAYYHSGQIYQAILKISRAIQLSPADPNWLDSRAEFYLNQGEYDKALADCRQAMSLDKKFAHPYYLCGLIWEKKDNLPAAAAQFQKYLELAGPEDPEADNIKQRISSYPVAE